MNAVEVHDGADQLGKLTSGVQRELAAHAETYCRDPFRRDAIEADEIVCRAAKIFRRLTGVEGHHELSGGIGARRLLAVKQVGREREVALVRKALAEIFDVVDESPPLLHDDQPGSSTSLWSGKVPIAGAAVRLEADHPSHRRPGVR